MSLLLALQVAVEAVKRALLLRPVVTKAKRKRPARSSSLSRYRPTTPEPPTKRATPLQPPEASVRRTKKSRTITRVVIGRSRRTPVVDAVRQHIALSAARGVKKTATSKRRTPRVTLAGPRRTPTIDAVRQHAALRVPLAAAKRPATSERRGPKVSLAGPRREVPAAPPSKRPISPRAPVKLKARKRPVPPRIGQSRRTPTVDAVRQHATLRAPLASKKLRKRPVVQRVGQPRRTPTVDATRQHAVLSTARGTKKPSTSWRRRPRVALSGPRRTPTVVAAKQHVVLKPPVAASSKKLRKRPAAKRLSQARPAGRPSPPLAAQPPKAPVRRTKRSRQTTRPRLGQSRRTPTVVAQRQHAALSTARGKKKPATSRRVRTYPRVVMHRTESLPWRCVALKMDDPAPGVSLSVAGARLVALTMEVPSGAGSRLITLVMDG